MLLDLNAIQSTIVSGLPLNARWTIHGTPLDYDFIDGRQGFSEFTTDVVGAGDEDWSDFLIFGKQDYAEGGGAVAWLVICKSDGTIHGLDPEREHAKFSLNSSVDRFVRTFGLLNNYLGNGKPLPRAVEPALHEIDPKAYPESDWRLLVECALSADPDVPSA
jgi:hypothetical protein